MEIKKGVAFYNRIDHSVTHRVINVLQVCSIFTILREFKKTNSMGISKTSAIQTQPTSPDEVDFIAILDHISDLVFYLQFDEKLDLKVKYINQAFISSTGFIEKDILNKNLKDLVTLPFFSSILKKYNNAISSKSKIKWEEQSVFPVGSRTFVVSLTPKFNGNKECTYLIGSAQDITQLNQVSESLSEIEDRWKFATEGAGDGVWDWNLQTNEVFFSKLWKEMLGFSDDEIPNELEQWDKRVHPDDKANAYSDINNHINGDTSFYINEHRMLCKDGLYKWILDRGKIFQWATDGKPLRMIGTHTDISERKTMELQLRESDKRFSAIFKSSPIGISLFRLSDKIHIDVNDLWCKITGYSEKEVIGKTAEELGLLTPKTSSSFRELVKNKRSLLNSEETIIKKNGEHKTLLISVEFITLEGEPHALVLSNDISDYKKAQKDLSYNQELLNEMGAVAKIGGWDFDVETGDGNWTDEVARIHDMDPNEKTNKEIGLQHYSTSSKLIIENAIQEAIEKGKPYDLELGMTTIKGNHKWIHTIGYPVYENGKVVRLKGSFQDITDRKKSNEALRLSEIFNTNLIKHLPQKIFIKDVNSTYIYCNDYFASDFNLTPKDIIGKSVFELYPKEKAITSQEEDKDVISKGIGNDYEAKYFSGGKEGFVHTIKVPYRDEKNRIVGVLGVLEDISDRKNAEMALKSSENKFKALVEQSLTGIYIFDKEHFIYVNKRLCEMFGYEESEIIGKMKPSDLIAREDIATVNKHIKDRLSGKIDSAHYSARGNRKDGKLLWLEIHGTIVEINNRNVITGTILDITERKIAEQLIENHTTVLEQKVKERTVQLKAKNKELETFAYSVSHDLKAPLRGIDGYSNLLEELYSETIDDEGKHFLKTIRQSAKQMNQLIEDLLSYSRLERTTIKITKVDVKQVVSNVLVFLNTEIESNHITIIDHTEKCEINTDFDSLSIALRNLIENGIKFSAKKEKPVIELLFKDENDSITIGVKDNGIGFDMKFHERIFEIFQRLNLPEQFTGTGIGLAMVKKSMERLNGTVWAESTPLYGATFFLKIPKTNDK